MFSLRSWWAQRRRDGGQAPPVGAASGAGRRGRPGVAAGAALEEDAPSALGRLGRRLRDLWRRPAQAQGPVAGPVAGPVGGSVSACLIEGRNYLFGFEWRLIPPTRALMRTLSLARKEGLSLYVLSEMEDIIGVGGLSGKVRGKKYSAAMHLASAFSQGGIELYAFDLGEDRFAVIALNESRPIPGFDFLGSRESARNLVDEFLAIQVGQVIRQVGNAGLLEAEESVAPEDLFARPVSAARVKQLSTGVNTRLLMLLGGILLVIMVGVLYWLDRERRAVIEESRRVSRSADSLYQTQLAAALRALPSAGSQRIEAWVQTAAGIPTRYKGWRLVRVQCALKECKAQWDRDYGSFSDFMQALPANAARAEEVQVQNDPARASILTWHPTVVEGAEIFIQPEGLLSMRLGLRVLSDRLQDLSLLGKASTQIDKPQLFGGQADVAQLSRPVFSGRWSLTHELWLIPHLQLPELVVAEALEIELFNGKGEPEEIFVLKGSYYVLGASP